MRSYFQRKRYYNSWLTLCLILFVATLFSGLMINHGVRAYLQGKATETWIRTKGEIIHSEIKSHSWRTRRSSAWVSRLWITYRYHVDGLEYRHQVSTFSSEGNIEENEKRLKPLLNNYAESKVIPVFYNPSNARKSILKQGGPPLWDVPTVLGIGILITSWMTGLVIWKVEQSRAKLQEIIGNPNAFGIPKKK